MDDSLAFRLAQGALAFEHKLAQLPDDVHPARAAQPGAPWQWIAATRDRRVRGRIVARLFPRLVAPWPPLAQLDERASRLALLDGDAVQRQLCLLALAARPGVLRGCIDRVARSALQAALGPAFEALALASRHARISAPAAACWTPQQWACAGYLDWIGMLQPQDNALRRMARLSLPPDLARVGIDLEQARRDLPAATAMARLDEMGVAWPC
jgi:hypothetical protein